MKKSLILFAVILFTGSLFAQRDNTLFNSNGRTGIFVTPWLTEYGQFGNDTRASFGGGIGVIVGDAFLGGYGLGNADFEQLLIQGEVEEVRLAHGGLWFGYVPMQHKSVHPYSSLRLGWGAVNIDESDFNGGNTVDGVNVITPEIGVEANVFRWLRVSAAVGYRWVNDVEDILLDPKDFDGVTGSINVRLGWFGRDRNWSDRQRIRNGND